MAVIVGAISSKDKRDNENIEKDVIVHEIDGETVEEKSKDGLVESDSEDGPVLKEENIIDFNGDSEKKDSDDKKETEPEKQESTQGGGNDSRDDNEETTEEDKQEESSGDTGSFGVFY